MTIVRACGGVEMSFGLGCGICAFSPYSGSIATTSMNMMISVNNTSIKGVTLICGPDGPPPAIEKAIDWCSSPARVSATSDTSWIVEVPRRDHVCGTENSGMEEGRRICGVRFSNRVQNVLEQCCFCPAMLAPRREAGPVKMDSPL